MSSDKNDQPLAPGLYLVATPIGNLEDITLRALRILRSADRIACEDTRQTQKLLNHFGIQTPTVSYHLHNEGPRAEELLTQLKQGARIAVVSDAGTPGIADPGHEIASAAIAAGIPVFPIPGANAAISALIASGLKTDSFTFHGFLPAKEGQRKTALEQLRIKEAGRDNSTHIFYEAPHRILDTLGDLAATFGPTQPIVIARELTKLHEEFLRGTASDLQKQLASRPAIRGEIVLLFTPSAAEAATTQKSIASEVAALMQSESLSEKDALKRVARDRGIGKSEAYRELQRERARS
ncbi:16S rRNA (cytidine(1402)-2'-O)-methyltransferase [Edaphobacter aggregans]|uniref:16S rRNA (cytidine(1402)-2'-O)-methyltransferase n=1 Tax=Edaphobacter aggregans TaxID=570835 RepID=UPI00054FD830|nr:16S rRNA (cytidine(1402)-2'-O)-methyltransferase [Edaphobacter aggregans]